jgi:hypothetical protein
MKKCKWCGSKNIEYDEFIPAEKPEYIRKIFICHNCGYYGFEDWARSKEDGGIKKCYQ